MQLSIGQRVRVLDVEGKMAHVATVSYLHTAAVDVIYSAGSEEEECNVALDRVSPLFAFEAENHHTSAAVWKDCGNQLFSAKDFNSAAQYYSRALELLSAGEISIGSQVLIVRGNDFVDGMVSNVDVASHTVEIELDDDQEMTVASKDTIKLAMDNENLKLQRSLYLNLAKCSLKKSLKGWAIRQSSIAIGIANYLMKNQEELRFERKEISKALVDSYYFRGKVLLESSRPHLAEKDCARLMPYDAAKATQLQNEIHAFRGKRQKENKKLAREIAKWVDTALQSSSNPSPSGTEEDLMIAGEAEEEEDSRDSTDSPMPFNSQATIDHRSSPAEIHPKAASSDSGKVFWLLALVVVILAMILSIKSIQGVLS